MFYHQLEYLPYKCISVIGERKYSTQLAALNVLNTLLTEFLSLFNLNLLHSERT